MKAPTEPPLSEIVQSILSRVEQFGFPCEVKVFTSPAQRASQAADLIGCPLGAVVKSLLFVTQKTWEYKLLLVSGENRAADERVREIFQQPLKPASPGKVLEKTGFSVGAVPPFGHAIPIPTVMDADLMAFDQVWASAGSEHVLMGLSPRDVQLLSKAEVYQLNG